MPEMVLPGVYIEERPEGLIVPSRVSVSTIGIVGTASKGPLGEPRLLGDLGEARQVFGSPDPFINGASNELTLMRALEQVYAQGASGVVAIRISSTEAAAAGENFIAAWGKNTKARKAAFDVAGEAANTKAVILRARSHGTWGNGIEVSVFDAEEGAFVVDERHPGPAPITLKRKPITPSVRNRVRVIKGATGQAKAYTVVDAAPASPNEVQINGATGVLTFAAGEAPVAADTLYASYLVGLAESRKVTTRSGATTEVYTVADGQHLIDQINDPDAPSALVEAVAAGADPAQRPAKHASADDFRPAKNGVDGADASDADYKLGLDTLLNENVHIMVAAGMADNAIGDELKAHAEAASTDKMKRDRIAVVGSRPGATFEQIRGHTQNSDRLVFVAPGIKATDSATGKEVTLPGAYAAAAIAGMLSSRDPHVSLTNKVIAVPALAVKFTTPQLEQLVQSRVLVLEEREGFRVVRAITTSTNTAWRQITTRRIVDYAKYGVRSAASPFIGLLNNDRVRAALRTSINSFLTEMVQDEMLISYDLEVTATRDEERKGIVRVTMTLRPVFSIDFIKVTMILE